MKNKLNLVGILLLNLIFSSNAFSAEKIINLTVDYKTVNFTGKQKKAIAVNNQIPGPTLHFKEGDIVTINVHNHLNTGTTIHWHGLLVPWQMDGVEGVSQKAIPPGGIFSYQFTLKQSGTYWYHAHTGFQEQQGLYGGIIIEPPHPPAYQYTKDYVVVLSDWSNTKPDNIFANLKKSGDYYSTQFPLQPSLFKFIQDYRKASILQRKKIMNDYKMMQDMRMSIYDFSDVAYDAALLNGRTSNNPWTAPAKVGDTIRLRFINAGGSTNFRVKIPGVLMKLVHVQGNDIRPYEIKDFFIAPGETYDILVKIEKDPPCVIYAESADTLNTAIGALVTNPKQKINYIQFEPFQTPAPITIGHGLMVGMDHGSIDQNTETSHTPSSNHAEHLTMAQSSKTASIDLLMHSMKMQNNHSQEKMPFVPTKIMDKNRISHSSHQSMQNSMDMNTGTSSNSTQTNHHMLMNDKQKTLSQTTQGTQYQNISSPVKTNDPNKPIQEVIQIELFGFMERYIWFINGKPEYKSKPILIEPGKRYRIVFTNQSMMHHPMHIHGHWFILRNGHNAYDPLLHTIDVAPGAIVVADFDADASGQWIFHCHHLYHMMAGMGRVFQYTSIIDIAKGLAKPQNIVSAQPYPNQPIIRVDAKMPIDLSLIKHPMGHSAKFYMTNYLDIGLNTPQNVQKITLKALLGNDYNKLELFSDEAKMKKGRIENANLDIFYWHLIDQFWALKGGANYYYRPSKTPYWQPGIGIEGLMPYFIDTNARAYYYKGNIKLDIELSRDTQITNHFFLRTGIRGILATKTHPTKEVGQGLNQMRYMIRPYYQIAPNIATYIEFEREKTYGYLKKIYNTQNKSVQENVLTVGLSCLF